MFDQTTADGYYRWVRKEIAPLLPATAHSILDVGAGAGNTGAWLRSRYPGSYLTALEGNPDLREELSAKADRVHILDLNDDLPDLGSPDLVLCLDILEHLVRPDLVLRRLTESMANGATVIVSVPNVAHLSVSAPLLFAGQFAYREAGILDRTHLRFFVRQSALALMASAGLTVHRGIRVGFSGPRTRMLDALTVGLARDRLTKQYVMAGQRSGSGGSPADVEWLLA